MEVQTELSPQMNGHTLARPFRKTSFQNLERRFRWLFIWCLLAGIVLGCSNLQPFESFHSSVMATTFLSNVPVEGTNPLDQVAPSLAIGSSGQIYVAWEDRRNGNSDMFFSRSLDGGSSFETPFLISDDGTGKEQNQPSITVGHNGTIVVVWSDWRNDADGDFAPGGGIDGLNNCDVYYTYSLDGGSSFSSDSQVNSDPKGWFEAGSISRRFVSVSPTGQVNIAWFGSIDGNPYNTEIYYSRSPSVGNAFSPELRLSNSNGTASNPAIHGSDNGAIFVTWYDASNGSYDIYSRTSTDNGSSFGDVVRVEDNISANITRMKPSVSFGGEKLGIVWEEIDEDGDPDVRLAVSIDYGKSFGPSVVVNEDPPLTPSPQWLSSISIDSNGYIAIAWEDLRNGDYDIYFTDSIDSGSSFDVNQRVNDDVGNEYQYEPYVFADDGEVFVVWQDCRNGNWDIYFSKSSSMFPDLVVSDDNIVLFPASPVSYGAQVSINATVHNFGERNATDIQVAYFDGLPLGGSKLGDDHFIDSLSFPVGEANVSADWIASEPQFHTVCVLVDPQNKISESNESNNLGCVQVEVILPVIPQPPTSLRAFLSGSGERDVTLMWELSSDDVGGGNVSRYDVFRLSGEYRANRGEFSILASVPAGSSTCVDASAGEGDPNTYFYYVCAIGDMNVSSCTVDEVGKFTRPLLMGPSLVSIPLMQLDESIETVLQTVEYDKAWTYDSFSGDWKWHMTFKSYRRGLWSVNHTMGMWVNATRECNLTVAGLVPSETSIYLNEGWNLIGFPSFNASYSVEDFVSETGAIRVEGYDSASLPYCLRLLTNSDLLGPGEGFWLRVNSDSTWMVRNV